MALVNNENCYKKSGNWENVTLADFMGCKSNLANNRQTRMRSLIQSLTCVLIQREWMDTTKSYLGGQRKR